MQAPTLDPVRDTGSPVSRSDQAEASSAHSRINIPLNLENWKDLPEVVREQLLWFHQFLLDNKMGYEAACQAVEYDHSTVFRILKGTYQGNWGNVCDAIKRFRRRHETPLTLKKHQFVETSIAKITFGALNYASANSLITIIMGESGDGKSVAGQAWKRAHNHGRTVMVIAPAFGGTKALLRDIAATVGINKNLPAPQMHESILRAFNRDRMLVVDEAHRLFPNEARTNPVNLEILRDIHDRTGCALALIATQRFQTQLKKGEYMFEQLVGRSLPIRLPRDVKAADVELITKQFVQRPSEAALEACHKVASQPGRFRLLTEILKVAVTMAKKREHNPSSEHIFAAIKLREQMQGETLYAK